MKYVSTREGFGSPNIPRSDCSLAFEGSTSVLVLGMVHSTPEKFENASRLLLDLPSTLICHSKGSFSETLFQPEGFESACFLVSCKRKKFERGAFLKR